MKTILTSVRALLLLILLFMPAMAVLLIAAFLTGSTRWFGYIGLPALLINGAIVFAKSQRDRIWRWLTATRGTTPAPR